MITRKNNKEIFLSPTWPSTTLRVTKSKEGFRLRRLKVLAIVKLELNLSFIFHQNMTIDTLHLTSETALSTTF